MIDIRDFVTPVSSTASLSNISRYVEPNSESNPISTFMSTRADIIRAGNAAVLQNHPVIGRLLLVGCVSAFENYCRGVLSGCLTLCPISQSKSSEKNVSLGGAIWHGPNGNFNRSAFEHKSLADTKELKSVFREYLDFDLGQPLFMDLINSYEVIMQLRHAVVHSDGYLPGRNAVKLEISRSHPYLLVKVNSSRVQEILLVLSTLASTINRELFSVMCRRWAIDWRRRADWQPNEERNILKAVFDLFVDKGYNEALPNRRKWNLAALRTVLTSQYSLV